jgi:regulator of replication initiation timing
MSAHAELVILRHEVSELRRKLYDALRECDQLRNDNRMLLERLRAAELGQDNNRWINCANK